MKFLIIAALLALLLLVLYSRLYPYIKFLRKILGTAKVFANGPTNTAGTSNRSTAKVDGKLVRCVSCGTWIPAARAVSAGAGRSVYCSRECIEKSSNSSERKIAG